MKKLKTKLTHRLLTVAMVSVIITAFAVAIAGWFTFSTQVNSDIKEIGQVIATNYNQDYGLSLLDEYNTEEYRITVIDDNGNIIYESNKSLEKDSMENHLNRPEIQDALNHGAGSSQRISSTLGSVTHYYAIRCNDGNVIRISKEVDSILNSFIEIIPVIIFIILLVMIICVLIASRSTKRIVEPIEKMTEDINNIAYEELVPFATTIEKQQNQIKKQMNKVQLEKDKVSALIANMNEGFLLLDMDKNILTSNESAYMLLNSTSSSIIGKNIIEISRNFDFINCINEAISGKSSTIKFTHNNNSFQVIASPVFSNGKQQGVICLIMNTTEKDKTEKMRREFTANVSHELKTPLTSISGFAEMIENGMVQNDEDIKRFAGKIHKEAGRLISLIIDIIDLSQLDEPQKNLEKQFVNLEELVKECFESLQNSANKRNVTLNYAGDYAKILCNRSMIYEVIYNLCDNAIRYNKPDGEVNVNVINNKDNIEITVSDTGIGIPAKHQNRIFERFYRVDKSHSKETGGTGLGLAIVKHIVEQHQGSITLESEVNVGTTIKIQLLK